MALKVGLLMDPIETINVKKDSTYMLGLEAQARGHELFYFTPDSLAMENTIVKGRLAPLTLRYGTSDYFTLGEASVQDLSMLDIVLVRQDPPFDMGYITATYLLEILETQGVLVANKPQALRDCAEKIFPLQFASLMPPTLISRDLGQIQTFYQQHNNIIIKPLYSCGGEGVFHIPPDAPNLKALVELYRDRYREPFIAQGYIPGARDGDKRIILCDGKPIGAVLRVPSADEHRANFFAGGSAAKADITERDQQICAAIAPMLQAKGLWLVGIDVVGGYLTEINVTSPTGIQEINRLNDTHIETLLWDCFEAKQHAHRLRAA